jgi:hypothetical protein
MEKWAGNMTSQFQDETKTTIKKEKNDLHNQQL